MSIGQILPGHAATATPASSGTIATPASSTPASTAGAPATAGSNSLGAGGNGGPFQLFMQMMQMMIMLLSAFLKQSAPALDTGEFTPVSGGNLSILQSAGIQQNSGVPASGTPVPKATGSATLDQSLAKIANDPEGAKLLAQAQKDGVTIQVGDPAQFVGSADAVPCNCPACQASGKAQADAGAVVNGVTLNNGGHTTIIVRDPSNIKTIVHELVHANSTQDGNSKTEEGVADVVGYRVASRIAGTQGPDQNAVFNSKIQVAAYAGLQGNNSIVNDLAQLGIKAFA